MSHIFWKFCWQTRISTTKILENLSLTRRKNYFKLLTFSGCYLSRFCLSCFCHQSRLIVFHWLEALSNQLFSFHLFWAISTNIKMLPFEWNFYHLILPNRKSKLLSLFDQNQVPQKGKIGHNTASKELINVCKDSLRKGWDKMDI